jgi:Putative zinc-finger
MNDLTHEFAQELLEAYLADELTQEEKESVRAHLQGCTVCQYDLQTIRKLRQQLRSLSLPAISSSVADEVMARLEVEDISFDSQNSVAHQDFRPDWPLSRVSSMHTTSTYAIEKPFVSENGSHNGGNPMSSNDMLMPEHKRRAIPIIPMVAAVLLVITAIITFIRFVPHSRNGTPPSNIPGSTSIQISPTVPMPTLPSTYTLLGIQMLSPDNGWIVGGTGADPLLMHYQNSVWSQIPLSITNGELTDISFSDANNGWAVGYTTKSNSENIGLFLRYNNGTWTRVDPPNPYTGYINHVSTINPDEFWALDNLGIASTQFNVIHYQKGTWNSVMISSGDMHGFAAVTSNEVWIGAYQQIIHVTGKSYTVVGQNLQANIMAVDMKTSTDGWAGGILLPTTSSTTSSTSSMVPLSNMTQLSDGRFSSYLNLYHYNGNTWEFIPDPNQTHGTVMGISVVGKNDVWTVGTAPRDTNVGGRNSLIAHYHNGKWDVVNTHFDIDLAQLSMANANEGWAIGYKDGGQSNLPGLIHYQNGIWSEYK